MTDITHDMVADYFLSFSREHGDYLTNLKLQKMVFYAQAWYLAIFEKPLFDADFQAWVHGPVCPELYQRFKECRWSPISENIDVPVLPDHIKDFLTQVFESYGQYSAYQLEQMTHQESPWLEARGCIPLDENSSSVITKESMRNFYSAQIEE